MQLTDRGMRIVHASHAVTGAHGFDVADVGGEIFDTDRRVFHELRRFRFGPDTHQQTQSGFSELPDTAFFRRVGQDRRRARSAGGEHERLARFRLAQYLVEVVALELNR